MFSSYRGRARPLAVQQVGNEVGGSQRRSSVRAGEGRSSVRIGEGRSSVRTGEGRSSVRIGEGRSSVRTGEGRSSMRTGGRHCRGIGGVVWRVVGTFCRVSGSAL